MKTGDIAALLVQGMQSQVTGNTDIGYHIGSVLSWDDQTALNTVQINGNEFNNLRVITPGPAINIEAGDTVVVMRFQTQYFILGKVAAPGASAAMRSVSDFAGGSVATTSTSYVGFSDGPSVSAYVGPSGKVMVLTSCSISTQIGDGGAMSFALTGANTQAAADFRSAYVWAGSTGLVIQVSNSVQVTGLAQGITTFTGKYRSVSGANAAFDTRSLIVIPM